MALSAVLLRIDWRKVESDFPQVEAKMFRGPEAEFKAVMMKAMMERTEPGYSYVVVAQGAVEKLGVG